MRNSITKYMKSLSPTRTEVSDTQVQPNNANTDENLNSSVVEMSSPTENSCPENSNVPSPKNIGAQKRRNLSGNSDLENSKKQNLNDTSDSIFNQIEVDFEKDTLGTADAHLFRRTQKRF